MDAFIKAYLPPCTPKLISHIPKLLLLLCVGSEGSVLHHISYTPNPNSPQTLKTQNPEPGPLLDTILHFVIIKPNKD